MNVLLLQVRHTTEKYKQQRLEQWLKNFDKYFAYNVAVSVLT